MTTSLFDLTGRAYVVTGGAGHLGKYICAGLANAGAHVLCASSKEGWFAGLVEDGKPDITSVICDVSHEAEFEQHVGRFRDRIGRLDGLVNNAVRAPRGIDLDMPLGQFASGLGTVLSHYFTCARIARHYMAGGSIVNMVSMWGMISPAPSVYIDLKNEPSVAMSAAAAGVLGMSRYLAVLMAKDGIRINSIVPGWFPKRRGADRPDYIEQITSRVPMGRIGRPEEIVGAVIFLLSGASSYMTGQSLVIDGGYSVQ